MRELGVNAAAMARAMGWAEQSVQWWLAVDDTKLSNVEAAIKALGYRLICSFEPEEGTTKPYKIIIDGLELLSVKNNNRISGGRIPLPLSRVFPEERQRVADDGRTVKRLHTSTIFAGISVSCKQKK